MNVCARTKSVVIFTISHMRGHAIGVPHIDFLDEGLAWGLTSRAIFFMVLMGLTTCMSMTFWNCYQDS